MTRRLRSREGVALLIVMGMVVLISAMAISFHDQMAARLADAKIGVLDAEALALARSGVTMGRLLLRADVRPYSWFHQDESGGAVAEDSDAANKGERQLLDRVYKLLAATRKEGLPLEGGSLAIDLIDENARINVNRATQQGLTNLFFTVGLKRKKKLEIIDEEAEEDISQEAAVSILNWRAPEGQKRAGGADDTYYQNLKPPYRSRSAPFETVEEVMLVKDIGPRNFFGTPEPAPSPAAASGDEEKKAEPEKTEKEKKVIGIGSLLTVHGDGRINVNNAARAVLRVTPGLVESPAREALVNALMHRRPFRSAGELSGVLSGGDPRSGASAAASLKVQSDVVRVRATGIRGPRRRTVEAVYSRRGPQVRTVFYRED